MSSSHHPDPSPADLAVDEQGVRDACIRYWAGVDRRDAGLFASAFTSGAMLSLLGGERVVKVADMVAAGRFGIDFEYACHAHLPR